MLLQVAIYYTYLTKLKMLCHTKSNINPIALRMAKTPQSFGHSECNWVKVPIKQTKFTSRVTGCRFVQFADSYAWIFQACTLFTMSIKKKAVT